jgi:radical SAM protein with 4Fe4S-binding SPASM domain
MRLGSILTWLAGGRRADPALDPLPLKNVSLCVNLDQCNLRCIMCWTTYSRGTHGIAEHEMDLPRERLLELLRSPSLRALDSVCVVGGGEPFLYPFMDDLLREAPTATRRLMIMTHGGLLHRSTLLWEVARTEALTIMVSIDGATAATYESIRRGSKWARVVGNVERLTTMRTVNPKFELAASYVVLDQNLDEVVDFVRLCAGWDVRYVHFHPAIAGAFPAEWRVDRASSRYREVMGRAIELCAAAGIALDSPDELLATPPAEGADPAIARDQPDPRRACRLPFESMSVSHQGEAYVCDTAFRLPYSCGNVFRDGPRGVWESDAWASLRAAHQRDEAAKHPLCSRCLLLA